MTTDDMKGARVLSHDGFSEKLGTIVGHYLIKGSALRVVGA